MEQKKLFPEDGGDDDDTKKPADDASEGFGYAPADSPDFDDRETREWDDEPPLSEPPSSEPDPSKPSSSKASSSEPPSSKSPSSGPPSSEPPSSKPPSSEPPSSKSPSSKPPSSEPPSSKPRSSKPPSSKAPVGKKGAANVPPPMQSMIAGAVLGGAIGDAMGHPTEFIGSVAAIRSRFGPAGVTRFELYWDRGGKRFAPYTDDTQMAEIVLRTLVASRAEDVGLDLTMRRMAEGFVEWADHPQGGHRAPGNACMSGARALARGAHWSEAGGAKAGGCGSVMRAYPFGLVFADDIARAERWSVAHSKLTHRDPIALAACAAMAVGMVRVLRGEAPMTIASEMVAAACRYSAPTAAMMADAIDDAVSGVKPKVTLDRLRAWAAHEAIAAAVYIFLRHPDDVSAAILEGTNTPGDSDSIATLAGAMVGARVGLAAIPEAWVRDVERSSELLELASRVTIAT